jgi:hypothetical protein
MAAFPTTLNLKGKGHQNDSPKPGVCGTEVRISAVSFTAMTNAADLDGVGIGADEEEPVVANAQPKFFSSLESFHIARARFRKAMQPGENMHSGGLA